MNVQIGIQRLFKRASEIGAYFTRFNGRTIGFLRNVSHFRRMFRNGYAQYFSKSCSYLSWLTRLYRSWLPHLILS